MQTGKLAPGGEGDYSAHGQKSQSGLLSFSMQNPICFLNDSFICICFHLVSWRLKTSQRICCLYSDRVLLHFIVSSGVPEHWSFWMYEIKMLEDRKVGRFCTPSAPKHEIFWNMHTEKASLCLEWGHSGQPCCQQCSLPCLFHLSLWDRDVLRQETSGPQL